MTDHVSRAHAFRNPSNASYWMECALWGIHKRIAEEEGGLVDRSSDAAERGRELHEVAEQALIWYLAGKHGQEAESCTRAAYKAIPHPHANALNDLDDVIVAVTAALSLISDGMEVALEVKVPLSYEPGEFGSVDILGFVEHDLGGGSTLLDSVLVADYKFGEVSVSPNSWQLRIYAMNALSFLRDEVGVKVGPNTKVKLAIIQPAHHLDPIVRVYDAVDLIKAQAYVEGVVSGQEGGDRRGAGSLKTCEWCDFSKQCGHRPLLVQSALANLRSATAGKIHDRVVEDIVRDASSFRKVLEDCVSQVKEDPVRFPNWTRVEVKNAEQWSPLIDVDKATAKLKGAQDLYVLNTPKRVRDANPTLTKKIDALVSDRGHHIRLYEGAPNNAPKEEPQRRAPKSGARVATGKVAKKAPKKAAKKSAKKAARRKT